MVLALLTSLVVAQTCPVPPSGAPPCAIAKVPGCVPGYWPVLDERSGRTIYVCAARLSAPPVASVAHTEPPPAAPPPAETRGHIGLTFMPGISEFPATTPVPGGLERQGHAAGQFALELRGSTGGGRLRFVGTYLSIGKIGEVSLKYDFLDGFFLRPFLAVGLGVASINPDAAIRGSGSASAGVDLFLSRDFFLTGEFNVRVFTNGTQGNAHGLAILDQRQDSFWLGLGFYIG